MQTMAGCGETRLTRWIQLHYELDYHLNGNKREMLKYTGDSLPPSPNRRLSRDRKCATAASRVLDHRYANSVHRGRAWPRFAAKRYLAMEGFDFEGEHRFFSYHVCSISFAFSSFFFCPSIIAFLLDKDSFDFLERMIAWRWGNCSIESFFFSQLQRQSIACKED